MKNKTALFGAISLFMLTGTGLKYGVDYNAEK